MSAALSMASFNRLESAGMPRLMLMTSTPSATAWLMAETTVLREVVSLLKIRYAPMEALGATPANPFSLLVCAEMTPVTKVPWPKTSRS